MSVYGESYNIKILAVDDDLVARKVIAKVLDNCGYRSVKVVSSGKEAYELIKSQPGEYNLLLCDVLMPEMDGLELLKKIKQLPNAKELAIVMISGTEDLQTVYSCLKEGADDYILKPIQQSVMKNVWSNVWKKRREHQTIFQLEKERKKSSHLNQELDHLKNQVEDLNCKIVQAVETPLSIITRTLADLQRKSNLTGEVEAAISKIIQSLRSSNLYKPALLKITENENLDATTKKWLIAELGFSSPLRYEDHSLPSSPSNLSPRTTPTRSSGSPSLSPNDLDDQNSEDTNHFANHTNHVGNSVSHSSDRSNKRSRTSLIDQRASLRSLLRDYSFDVWQEKEDHLPVFLLFMFEDFNLFDYFKIDRNKLTSFISVVKSKYLKSNPYHNFTHAFDVTQTVYTYLTIGNAASLLKPLEILSLLFASICHDIGHPGLNNSFLISTRHLLSIRYNDLSVLENFHASSTFELLENPELNFLSSLSRSEFLAFRKSVILCILATDLAKHMEILNRAESISSSFDRNDPDHRSLLMKIMIKAADISNPCKPFPIARYWADLVQEEFFIQGDKEKENGMEVSIFMDRENYQLSKMQMGFADYFVIPLFAVLHDFLPETKSVLETLHDNRLAWANISVEE